MSDQADSERTRSCTRLLYIPTRKTPTRTMTARTIQAMADSPSFPVETRQARHYTWMRIQGDVNTERAVFQSFRLQPLEATLKMGNSATLTPGLLPWSVVCAAGADLKVFFHGSDFDGAVASIGVEVGGLVRNVVLAAQFVFNGGEGVRDVFHLVGEEGAAAGGGSEVFENFVTAQNQSAVVGGDRINENFGALRHLNGLGARVLALIVFAVAEDDQGFANGMLGMFAQEFVLAGCVNRVIERGAAAIAEALHSGGE